MVQRAVKGRRRKNSRQLRNETMHNGKNGRRGEPVMIRLLSACQATHSLVRFGGDGNLQDPLGLKNVPNGTAAILGPRATTSSPP